MNFDHLYQKIVTEQSVLVLLLLALVYFMFKYFDKEKHDQNKRIETLEQKMDVHTEKVFVTIVENTKMMDSLSRSIKELSNKIDKMI